MIDSLHLSKLDRPAEPASAGRKAAKFAVRCAFLYTHILLFAGALIALERFFPGSDAPKRHGHAAWGIFNHMDSAFSLGRLRHALADNHYHRQPLPIAKEHFNTHFAGTFAPWDRLFGTKLCLPPASKGCRSVSTTSATPARSGSSFAGLSCFAERCSAAGKAARAASRPSSP